jgi:glycyl-tRNA synthetase
MAHYAADCWDAEIKLSYGWIECVGHADRACYDLQQHSNRTGVALTASSRLDEPVLVEKNIAVPNKKLIGPKFKGDQKQVITALEELDGEELETFQKAIESSGVGTIAGFEITSDLVAFKAEKKMISGHSAVYSFHI